ncbi:MULTISPECIES: serine hydrolase [unclassified Phenylobacterium]|uniref:serine hydrolase domain-containing protein n=1 Tax=unclassified Phenylobacterium TaxID=2640670 RepID=UPI00083ADC6F|nr:MULTISPECIES: serine hydrolase [unclassified Phenylobacterium]
MARLLTTLLAALLVVLATPASASADGAKAASTAAAPASDAQIERWLRFRIERQRLGTGGVVAILRPSGRSLIAYGPSDRGRARRLGGDSVFEIASLSKVFTALLLADFVVGGDARLEDPLAKYVPTGVTVPQFDGAAITLADLATHTSGLPLRPGNLEGAPDRPNKYAGYSFAQLYADLPNHVLTHAPGSQFRYSNLGVALLGQGLAFRAQEPFPELLRRRVTGPLGLVDTHFGDPPEWAGRRAQGHDPDLNAVVASDDGVLSPAGGLRSTPNDLLRLMELFLTGVGPGELPAAARLMMEVDRPGDDANTRMALGWRRTTIHGETYYWSHGSGDGARTFMGFNPARRIGVVAIADAASGAGLDDIARRVLDPQQDVDLKVTPRRREIAVPAAALERVLGTYEYAADDRLQISRGETGLIVTAGAGQLLIVPQSPTRFFSKYGGDILFDFPGSGRSPSPTLVLRQDAETFVYRRVP